MLRDGHCGVVLDVVGGGGGGVDGGGDGDEVIGVVVFCGVCVMGVDVSVRVVVSVGVGVCLVDCVPWRGFVFVWFVVCLVVREFRRVWCQVPRCVCLWVCLCCVIVVCLCSVCVEWWLCGCGCVMQFVCR